MGIALVEMIINYKATGGVDDVVFAHPDSVFAVEGKIDVGGDAVLVVVTIEGEGAGDGQPVAPTVGQDAHGGKPQASGGGIAHESHVVVGHGAEREKAGGAEAALVDKHHHRQGESLVG